ncbi:MAG TPA: MTAP family purine nucleoside phosphorylase [Capsulimonadaceae bacterium]
MSNEPIYQPQTKVAVIGGSGFADALDGIYGDDVSDITVQTDYGTVHVSHYSNNETSDVYFISRHGKGHSVPPHCINHHANIAALAKLNVTDIIATSAVGSLRRDLDSGTIIVLDDFVDLRGQVTTFFDQPGRVRHTDFSEPFSSDLRQVILEEAGNLAGAMSNPPLVYPAGTYLCLSGPRYETPGEVRLFGAWGLDVVGMTVASEAILARELDIRYANIALVTNLGTGLSSAPLSHLEVESQMLASRPFIVQTLQAVISRLVA